MKRIIFLAINLFCLGLALANSQDYPPEKYLSGTQPVLYINTADGEPVLSREEYVEGQYWLDANGISGYQNIGSADEPLSLLIKCRGNHTYNYPKKPYRLKLDEKAGLLGMSKNRHFVLLAEAGDFRGVATEALGFEVSRRVGLSWTPEHKPVELVLNGNYEGLYFLTEKIREGKNRVNIVEQADGEEDPYYITGGWLLEIDNNVDEHQIVFTEGNGLKLRITHHMPEELSEAQHDYLSQLITATDAAIYCTDKTDRQWEQYIDIDSLALFYIAHEIMDNGEAFSGSCYMYKNLGDSTKLIFGPVWDFGNAFTHYWWSPRESFIYEALPSFFASHWMKEIARFPRFQQCVRKHWQEIYSQEFADGLDAFIVQWCKSIEAAGNCDQRRWPQFKFDNAVARGRSARSELALRFDFLKQAWGDYPNDVNLDGHVNGIDANIIVNCILGRTQDDILGRGDVNGDGSINGADLNAIIRAILAGAF